MNEFQEELGVVDAICRVDVLELTVQAAIRLVCELDEQTLVGLEAFWTTQGGVT